MVAPALPVSIFRPFAFLELVVQLDQSAAALQLVVVEMDSVHPVAAEVAATVEHSFDSSLMPSASSTYSLLIEIQEAEYKDPSLLHLLQVVVVEAVWIPVDPQRCLENPIQNQGHKLELHKLLSLLVDHSKEVPEDLEYFLQNSKVELLHKIWHLPIQVQQHLTSILESSQLLQE